MINYSNPTDNEIRRIVAEALDPVAQIEILSQFTGKEVDDIRSICGMKPKKAGTVYKSRKIRYWTDEEIDYLFEHRNKPIKEQAEALKRNKSVISAKRKELGINRKRNRKAVIRKELI